MGQPITTKQGGTCFAFPNVCWTPAPPSPSPMAVPYPSVGQLNAASRTASKVLAGGFEVVTTDSEIPSTTGDSAGTTGVKSTQLVGGKVTFPVGSSSVFAESKAVVRLGDPTSQNNGNASGTVLGGFATVLVG